MYKFISVCVFVWAMLWASLSCRHRVKNSRVELWIEKWCKEKGTAAESRNRHETNNNKNLFNFCAWKLWEQAESWNLSLKLFRFSLYSIEYMLGICYKEIMIFCPRKCFNEFWLNFQSVNLVGFASFWVHNLMFKFWKSIFTLALYFQN